MIMVELRGRLNGDGSLTVWASRWQATFPAGGDAPACAEADSVPADAVANPPGVRIAQREGRTSIRYGDWIVTLGSGEPVVRPAKPDIGPMPSYFYRTALGDASHPDA